ncbi:molybdate ABC transporter substrate-binding protein [Bacillus sp. A301a_S52]|nr:molybdate ABC transporter substrate-binding protein [Bacillus sp. A301a_S52]
MLKKVFTTACLLGTTLTISGCHVDEGKEEIYVLTAASMTEAMEEIKQLYEKEHEGVTLVPSYGSSGQLKDQIIHGAPAHLFLPAALTWMEELDQESVVLEYAPLLENELVLITGNHIETDMTTLEELVTDDIASVAMGHPDLVPAGNYAMQALEERELYDALSDKIIYASNVREVLTYIETGNADAGLVYKTEAHSSDNVNIVTTADGHDSILYPVGLLVDAAEVTEARDFYKWLQTEEALTIFESYGFGVR